MNVGGVFGGPGDCGGGVCLVRPGGGEKGTPVVLVKIVRLGLMGNGVPSSSSGVGGGVVGWAAEPGSLSMCGGANVTLALSALELDERVWKKLVEVKTKETCGEARWRFLETGVDAVHWLMALRLATVGLPTEMSSV